MKRILTIFITSMLIILLTGCPETPTVYNNDNYNGEAMKIADGIYFKKVYIQGMYALLQCDKDGNVTHNQNINTRYQQGKSFVCTATITPTVTTTESNFVFNFKCTEIDNCYEQILIVKNSLNK